jgi:hypothetical protein
VKELADRKSTSGSQCPLCYGDGSASAFEFSRICFECVRCGEFVVTVNALEMLRSSAQQTLERIAVLSRQSSADRVCLVHKPVDEPPVDLRAELVSRVVPCRTN